MPYREITHCRICGNQKLDTILALGNQYLTGVFPKFEAEAVTSGPVDLIKCDSKIGCGLVQLRQSYDVNEMYGENYGYRSGLNSHMVQHLHKKVADISAYAGLKDGDVIIDIGSNDATTLRAYPSGKFRLIGVDPTGNKYASFYGSDVELLPDFFSASKVSSLLGSQKAAVVSSFSMFYDLEDPIAFARDVSDVIDADGIWVFEQSYLPTMLSTNSFDTICHEHLEFYSLRQIEWILNAAGMKALKVEFNSINGGSFSVIAAKKSSRRQVDQTLLEGIRQKEITYGLDNLKIYEDFRNRVNMIRSEVRRFLVDARVCGKKVCGLGASTKGNVLLQYFDIGPDLISSVAEVNEDKFGAFTPGTLIPIRPEQDVLRDKPDYLFVLPWHFKSFFTTVEKYRNFSLVFPLPDLQIINPR